MDIFIYALFTVLVLFFVIAFLTKTREQQIQQLKEWLIYAVAQAEKQLGGGQGQMKLRQVFDQFIQKFPSLVPYVSFEYFSHLVDEALDQLRTMLGTNEKLQEYIGSDNI